MIKIKQASNAKMGDTILVYGKPETFLFYHPRIKGVFYDTKLPDGSLDWVWEELKNVEFNTEPDPVVNNPLDYLEPLRSSIH